MTSYSADTLDLSRLGAPSLVEADYAAEKARGLAELKRLWALARAIDPTLPDYNVEMLETDPAVILTEEFAHALTLARTAINDTAATLRLVSAGGVDLDHLAITYHNTGRLVLAQADPAAIPPRPELRESDGEYRERAQLAPEAFPEFGITPGGYVYRVRRKYGDRVKAVRSIRREGGRVDLYILGRAGDGTPAPELIGDIQGEFSGDADSQSTDIVTVRPARVVPYAIEVRLSILPGPDPSVAEAQALARLQALAAARHTLNAGVPVKQVDAAALGAPAIAEDVARLSPAVDLDPEPDAAPYCIGITVLPSEVIR